MPGDVRHKDVMRPVIGGMDVGVVPSDLEDRKVLHEYVDPLVRE